MVSINRVVPVQEDLTKEELHLNVLRGMENMFRVDKKLAVGSSLELGQWGVLQNDGTVAVPGASSSIATYLVFCGSERFDSMATGQVTLIMNSNIIIKTDRFDAGGSYSVGTELTVKGSSELSVASTGDFVVGMVSEVGSGYLVVEVFAAARKKA